MVVGAVRVGVVGAKALNVLDRAVHAVHDLGGDDRVEIFGRPILVPRGLHALNGGAHRLVAAYLAAGLEQHLDERTEAASGARRGGMCVASSRAAASRSPFGRAAWMAGLERAESDPPRRMAAFPAF